jgi:1,4-alpha-glucan branching enzyme
MTDSDPATGSDCPRPGRGWRSSTPTARLYDGTGTFTNPGPITATADPYDGFPASATIVVPPMGAVFLTREPRA